MTAEAFVELLEQRGLVPVKILRKLRETLSAKGGKITDARIADALVEAGHLSRYQADRILAEMGSAAAAEILPEAAKDPPDLAAQDAIGFALLDDEPAARKIPARSAQPRAPTPEPASPRHSPLRSAWNVTKDPLTVDPTPSQATRPPLDELDTLLGPGDTAAGPWGTQGIPGGRQGRRMRRRRARRWDSPLLLIGGGALLFLVLLTVGLVWSIRRENAGEVIRKADEDYAAQA